MIPGRPERGEDERRRSESLTAAHGAAVEAVSRQRIANCDRRAVPNAAGVPWKGAQLKLTGSRRLVDVRRTASMMAGGAIVGFMTRGCRGAADDAHHPARLQPGKDGEQDESEAFPSQNAHND